MFWARVKRIIKRIILGPDATPGESEIIEVTLEELSSIWMKYNHDFSPQPVGPSATTAGKDGNPETETVQPFDKDAYQPPQLPEAVLSEFVDPYKSLLDLHGATRGILSVMELLERSGKYPSVVDTGEGAGTSPIAEILKKVTLREHSYDVARQLLKMVKTTYRDWENWMPRTLTTALAHDIGKIPEVRGEGPYAKADHAAAGADKLCELFGAVGESPVWLNAAAEAVRGHHRDSEDLKDQFCQLLRLADTKARGMEVERLGESAKAGAGKPVGKVMEMKEWFDSRRLCEIMRLSINAVENSRWKAFSFGSLVYCQPDLVVEAARQLAGEKGAIDISLMDPGQKQSSVKRISEALKASGTRAPEVGEGYSGRKYEIRGWRFGSKPFFLIPIKIEAFGKAGEIEKNKDPALRQICAVVPVNEQAKRLDVLKIPSSEGATGSCQKVKATGRETSQ